MSLFGKGSAYDSLDEIRANSLSSFHHFLFAQLPSTNNQLPHGANLLLFLDPPLSRN
jgi:hypothetical protein